MRPFFLLPVTKGEAYQLFNPADNQPYQLNYSGYRVLELCDGVRIPEEIAGRLAGEQRLTVDQAAEFVREFLAEVTGLGLVAWREEPLPAATGWSAPASVFWDITDACNLRCRHCYSAEDRPSAAELTTAEVRRVLEEMAAAGVGSITFSGGEPLLRRDFLDLAEHAAGLGFASVGVASNGTLVTPEAARRLKAAGLTVQVSIDGDTAAVHDRIRGRGAFAKSLRGIRTLQEAGIAVAVCTTANALNVARTPAIIERMKKLGVAQHRFQGVLPVGQGRENSARLALAPERMRELVGYLEAHGVPVTSYTFTLKPAPEAPVDFCSSGACSAASTVCAVTADGRVVPCSYFWGYRGESLRDHSFAWIWENSPLLRYFRTIRLDDVRGVCRECRWLALCHGGCKAENVINGDLYTAGGSCWVAPELAGGAAAALATGG